MLYGCPPNPSGNSCFSGAAVTIPATDATPPAMTLDVHLPDGKLVTLVPGSSGTADVTSASGGTVTLIAKATDPEGVRDVQLWVQDENCHVGQPQSCSGPGLGGAPSATNPDTQGTGATGCTERVVTENVQIGSNGSRFLSQQVFAKGVNFGGGTTDTQLANVGVK